MKKLFLLLAVGASISASAQNNNSIVLEGRHDNEVLTGSRAKLATNIGIIQKHTSWDKPMTTNTPLNKSSDKNTGEWFCFADASIIQNTSYEGLLPVTPDSNLNVYGTGNFNWYLNGLGAGFDPKSKRFSPALFQNSNPVYPMPTFELKNWNAYTVDQVGVKGFYHRASTVNTVDTLNIYLAYAGTGTNVYYVSWNYSVSLGSRLDSQLDAMAPIYDWQSNSFNIDSLPNRVKIVKLLDAAAYADSTTDGYHEWQFPCNLNVSAGNNVVVLATFGSQINYALNAALDTANFWYQQSWSPNGQNNNPTQLYMNSNLYPSVEQKDYNEGLGAFSEERYHFGSYYYFTTTGGGKHATLAPTYSYTPHSLSDPWFAFHIKCPTCNYLSVNDVKNNVTDVAVYPNPATEEVIISYNVKDAKANISVTNAVGQVVATQTANGNGGLSKAHFNTSSLSNGVYFYTVEANGERASGRFVVAH